MAYENFEQFPKNKTIDAKRKQYSLSIKDVALTKETEKRYFLEMDNQVLEHVMN